MKTNIKNMIKAMALPACAALALLASAANSEAAVFAKYDGVDGSSADIDHKDWIVLESVTAPIVRETVVDPETGVVSNRGDVVFGDIVLVKKVDKSTTKLIFEVCHGEFSKEVEIHVCTSTSAGGRSSTSEQPYIIYKLKDAVISSYKLITNADGTAYEEITLGYTKVEWTYVAFDPKTGAKIGEPVTVVSDLANTGE
jgi:type VI secretion system secreted protein Hcp